MTNLRSNQQPVYYRNYLDTIDSVDDNGLFTGEKELLYTSQKQLWAALSPNRGVGVFSQFGAYADYDRTMTTANTNVDIDEHSILWVDGADPNGPHNYIVMKRAAWKNSLQFAIKEVKVT